MNIIGAKKIYTLVENSSDKGLITDGYIKYKNDGTIISTGKIDDLNEEEKTQMKFYEGAIVPGLVNSHCHLELSYLKGMFRKGTGMAGFIDQINEMRNNKSHDEIIEDIQKEMQNLCDQGVVAMGDISNCSDTFEIKSKSPMYTRTYLEVFGTELEDKDSVMEGVRKLKQEAEKYDLDAAPTPHSCYTMHPELLKAASKDALTDGFLSYHSEESDEEEDMMKFGKGKMYENRLNSGMTMPPVVGKSSLLYFIDLLEEIHKPPFNENILLVHEVCMDQEGIDKVKEVMTNPYIALCPLSNIFIHNALPPVDLLRKNKMNLTIGTDSLSSNDELNMVKEMFCLQLNFPDLELGEILNWACLNGAKMLKIDSWAGTIEHGKTPGLVYIDKLDESGKLTPASISTKVL